MELSTTHMSQDTNASKLEHMATCTVSAASSRLLVSRDASDRLVIIDEQQIEINVGV